MLASPDGRKATLNQHSQLTRTINAENDALELLGRAKYGDFDPTNGKWMNVTGLRPEDGYAWELLPKVKARISTQTEDVLHASWIQNERMAHQKLETGVFGDRYLSVKNMDGLAEQDKSRKAQEIPFYRNITGIVRGKWVRSDPSGRHIGDLHPLLNVSAISSVPYGLTGYSRNITGHNGHLTLKLDERVGDSVRLGQGHAREIGAEMTIQDDHTSSDDGWEATLHGIHYLEAGAVLLSTTSDKFTAASLPHLSRSVDFFQIAQSLLNRTLTATINDREHSYPHPSHPWALGQNHQPEITFPILQCEYVIFLQQHFVWPYEESRDRFAKWLDSQQSSFRGKYSSYIDELEHEMRFPTGANLGFIPKLKFSAVVFSPDCGFVLESKGSTGPLDRGTDHLQGQKVEAYHRTIRRAVELLSVLIGAQISLLVRQMKDASTPSTRSRISYYTIGMTVLGDGLVFLSFMALSLFTDVTFLMIIFTAFLAFLSVSFFGMKFLMDIYTVQAPERENHRRRTRPDFGFPDFQNSGIGSIPDSPQNGGSLGITTPQDSGAAPVILLPSGQNVEADTTEANLQNSPQTNVQTPLGSARREMGAFYSKFYFLLIAIAFLSLNATTWPTAIRATYANALVGLYLSFWVPQIVRNIKRNCRKALRWEFVLGQSILRLLPFVYLHTTVNNVLFVRSNVYTLYISVGWVNAQVLVLVSQELFGPRFLVPKQWASPAYDYHPIIREYDEETGSTLPIGLTQRASEGECNVVSDEPKNRKSFDCAICMQNFDVPIFPANGTIHDKHSLGRGMFSRRAYMVTPCRHIFHSVCLEGWLRYKLVCPVCRDNLPPT